MGILNRINPFVQVMYDDKLNAKRKNLDAALTLVFLVVVIVYCVDSVNTWLNPHVFTSKCLTTGDGLDPMTIKELCYTPEKPYEPALSAFTCRGTFGAEGSVINTIVLATLITCLLVTMRHDWRDNEAYGIA